MRIRFPHKSDGRPCCNNRDESFVDQWPAWDRCFEPDDWFTVDLITVYDTEECIKGVHNSWTQLACPNLCCCRGCREDGFYSYDPLIIAVDGACRGNGTANSSSAIGVWFGEGDGEYGNHYNVSRMTSDVTSCQAEISAAIAAIRQYEKLVKNQERPRDDAIIIRTDSQYLVDSISVFINNWQRTEQGWFTEAGRPVRNSQWWDCLLNWIQFAERNGTRVLFWWVPREWNYLVDSLANAAYLDNGHPEKYLELNDARAEYADESEASSEDDYWMPEEIDYAWR